MRRSNRLPLTQALILLSGIALVAIPAAAASPESQQVEPDVSSGDSPKKPINPGLDMLCPLGCQCMTGALAEQQFGAGSFASCSTAACGHGWVGDLFVAKYCYRDLSLEECVDSDGGKDYDVKGSAPGCEDSCSPFSHPPTVLLECYTVVENEDCKVATEAHVCPALCEDGACLPPTCDDWIQNQGEQGVDCGGPCPDPCSCPLGSKCATGMEAEKVFGPGSYHAVSDAVCGYESVGDLNVGKYCFKKLSTGDCQDTDGGLNIYVKGTAPGCEDRCSPFNDETLEECFVEQQIDGCQVHLAAVQCGAPCEDGRCVAPTCADLIQNQGEGGVDCGGPCPNECVACSWCGDNVEPIRISGQFDKGFIDVVFVPHVSYQGGSLAFGDFLAAAKRYIRDGYFQLHNTSVNPIPLDYRDRFNFYYYIGGFGELPAGTCSGTLPSGFWSGDHADFADVAGILRNVQGKAGCASSIGPPGHFQARDDTDVVMHESGHVLFGWADEYCGCRAGYGQFTSGNLWSSLEHCQSAATDEGWMSGSCRAVCDGGQAEQGPDLSTCPDKNLAFWRYDNDPDLMGTGGNTINEACVRKMNYAFDNWPAGGSKGLLVWFKIESDEVTLVSAEVTDAHPDVGLQQGPFEVKMLSAEDRTIESFDVWDPRIELGEAAVFRDDASFPVRFPWLEGLEKIVISEKASGELMVTVDLREVLERFCKEHPRDADCRARKAVEEKRPKESEGTSKERDPA